MLNVVSSDLGAKFVIRISLVICLQEVENMAT